MAQTPPDNYISSTSLDEYFVNENTGLPLAGGRVTFYEDKSRTTTKLVYKLTGDPDSVGGYDFAFLPNPMILSATGTFVDNNGDNVAVYYKPYDADGNLDLYYVTVADKFNTPQFTRSAWPPIANEIDDSGQSISYENQLSNSQFVDILFSNLANGSHTYNIPNAGTFEYNIAPDWVLVVVASAATSVTVERNAITGNASLVTNPPFSLTITPGANINANGLYLRQRLPDNPGIWSQSSSDDTTGYVSASLVLSSGSTAQVVYFPSNGTATQILAATNGGVSSARFEKTIQLPVSDNLESPYDGYVDINISISNNSQTTLTSIQFVGLPFKQDSVPYIQETVSRQLDNLYHYYQPQIFYKPIPSYLVGWDFPLNPANVTGYVSQPLDNLAGESQYVWDQTIVWTETAGSNITYDRTNSGALKLTAGASDSQVAVIQYLSKYKVAKILSGHSSVNISASTSKVGGLSGTVSLYYSKGAALPSLISPTNQSIVASLNADGSVNGLNQTTGDVWVPHIRSLVNDVPGSFDITSTTAGSYSDFGISGWGAAAGADVEAANFFAIVVGFESIPANGSVTLNSISLVPGDIPTIPAPQTQDEVLRECQAYFWRTYAPDVPRGTANEPGFITYIMQNTSGTISGSNTANVYTFSGFAIEFPSSMRIDPNLTFYNLNNGTISEISSYVNILSTATVSTFLLNESINKWSTSSGIGYINNKYAVLDPSGIMSDVLGEFISRKQVMMVFHLVADARLGIN
jgi:hypothetical protein